MSQVWLDFEKPVAELEAQIRELRELAQNRAELEVSEELVSLERKAERLRRDLYSNLSR